MWMKWIASALGSAIAGVIGKLASMFALIKLGSSRERNRQLEAAKRERDKREKDRQEKDRKMAGLGRDDPERKRLRRKWTAPDRD